MKLKNSIIVNFISVGLILSLVSCMNMRRDEKLEGVVVINVLEKELYDDCHIAGSINVPFENIEAYASAHISTSADIVLYCSNYLCSASGHSVKLLKRLGFEHVAAYEGGTAEWYQNKLPVVGECKAAYLHKKNNKMGVAVPENDVDYATISLEELKKKIRVD